MFGRKRRPGRRPAEPGEVCTCGAPAVLVFDYSVLGEPIGSCMSLDPHTRSGPCPFCGTSGPHASGGGICPHYRLRPGWGAGTTRYALAG